jgi:hypothetical protein
MRRQHPSSSPLREVPCESVLHARARLTWWCIFGSSAWALLGSGVWEQIRRRRGAFGQIRLGPDMVGGPGDASSLPPPEQRPDLATASRLRASKCGARRRATRSQQWATLPSPPPLDPAAGVLIWQWVVGSRRCKRSSSSERLRRRRPVDGLDGPVVRSKWLEWGE